MILGLAADNNRTNRSRVSKQYTNPKGTAPITVVTLQPEAETPCHRRISSFSSGISNPLSVFKEWPGLISLRLSATRSHAESPTDTKALKPH
jgi:hypothetical protein